jgi:hypothetical protein
VAWDECRRHGRHHADIDRDADHSADPSSCASSRRAPFKRNRGPTT